LQTKQILNDTEILEEVMMMGLRLEDGITDGKLKKIFRQRFCYKYLT
jgi:coproporphyrinogen III oxidase-like Fe-S oxidoreductase